MLTLTDHAQNAVRTLTQDPAAPDSAGLRITPGHEGFELMLVAEPVPGDTLIDDGGARVFVEPQAAELLEELTLDAQIQNGELNFFLSSPEELSSFDVFDDETASQNGSTHSERLPE